VLDHFLGSSRTEVLEIDGDTARLYGEVATQLRQSGWPIQQNDIWIAALCKQHGYALATADSGFRNIFGLEVISF
jgi:predicted nucleic acid-binding protein